MSSQITVTSIPLVGGRIAPFLYGDFIELLNDLIAGMWAEKLQDRSFAGVLQPQQVYPPGQNWDYPRWHAISVAETRFESWPEQPADLNMVQADAVMELDTCNPFVGARSAKVTVRGESGARYIAGIAQDGIAIQSGKPLHIELFARCDGLRPAALHVLLGRNYGVFFHPYAQLEFEGLTPEWQRFCATFTPDTTDPAATLVIGQNQPGAFWLDKTSLMPGDNQRGWRSDVVEAIRDLQPGIIRFGGSSLIYYDWRIGVGPRERRVPFENRPWGNLEENDVGLHEFLEFCELVQAQPLICLNSNSATVEQILEEIEYCNGDVATKWGSLRAAMGHPEPFNVKYWQIGNEQAGDDYERRMVNTARAIRNRYPDLTLLASYPSDNILLNLSDEVDYVCPHIYTPYSQSVESELQVLIDKIRNSAKNRNLKIAVTEWNHTGGHWGWARAWLMTMYNALNAARMYSLYQRHSDMVHIANRSNMTNSCNSGILQTRRDEMYVTPTYYVQRAYAHFSGDRALLVQHAPDEILDVAATQRSADGEIALFVVNCTAQDQQRNLDIPGAGLPAGHSCKVWTLAATDLTAVNSFNEKTCVAPVESELSRAADNLEYTFPPFSVTVFRFRAASGDKV